MNRSSLLVKVGRVYQQVSPILAPIDSIYGSFLKNGKTDRYPSIFIVAPPRSGSTLLYQILTSSIKNIHLTNIWNLLYATPIIGALVSKRFLKNYNTSFSSKIGFVTGMAGEAEGLAFWKYWIGQTLEEDISSLNERRAKKLKVKIDRIIKTQEAYINGYLGHSYSIPLLNKVFQPAIFIHLKRNLLLNAESILKSSPNEFNSLKPKGLNLEIVKDRYEQIAMQIVDTHYSIYKNRTNIHYFPIRYDEYCKDPKKAVRQIQEFVNDVTGIDISTKTNHLPSSFNIRAKEAPSPESDQKFSTAFKDQLKNKESAFISIMNEL